MINKTLAIVAIAAVAALMVAGLSLTTDHVYATKKKTQTTAQSNVCGDQILPLDIFCQTISNEIQGNANAVNAIGQQP